MPLLIDQTICRTDNFAVLVHDPATGATAAIDAPDAAAIAARLSARGWRLTDILVTHHHGDHTAGIRALKEATRCVVRAPAAEADRIPAVDIGVAGGDSFRFGAAEVRVIATPGHTAGHVVFHLPGEALLFAGDTLFALGCGRVIETDRATMWASLSVLAALPRETAVYCGHDYEAANAAFALTVEPFNLDLQERAEQARGRGSQAPDPPTTIGAELAANPFLRASRRRVKRAIGMEDADAAEVFAVLRGRKDEFRG